LQKPARIYVEKSLDDILQRPVDLNSCRPGDRDDNRWVTIDGFQPPASQQQWEEMCFLDKSFHGYYTWPKTIRYVMNKRERYERETMPEQVAIVYERFMDKKFLARAIEYMVKDEDQDEIKFDVHRFRMFKVGAIHVGDTHLDTHLHRAFSVTSVMRW
jgi:hypothetical protein